ncbi:MAG: hypothetical protein L0323_23495, partial [Planctomycetes bacterium]|nr:hypothetical protein [Planctomycetota bacterium]
MRSFRLFLLGAVAAIVVGGVTAAGIARADDETGKAPEKLPARVRASGTKGVYLYDLAPGTTLELVYVPPGDFTMGSDDGADTRPRH